MAVVGAYSLDLYCDVGGDSYGGNCPHKDYDGTSGQYGFRYPAQFVGANLADCMKQARQQGWKFSRDKHTAKCPRCSGKR